MQIDVEVYGKDQIGTTEISEALCISMFKLNVQKRAYY